MHDDSGAAPLKARNRALLNFTISENPGSDARLDLLCGHFSIAPPHDRLLRNYLPPVLIVRAGAQAGEGDAKGQLAGLVTLMRGETAGDQLGGRAMLNALSMAMFALVLRLASETGATLHAGCLPSPVTRASRRWLRPCSTRPRAHGRCPSSRNSPTCRARHSPVNSRTRSDVHRSNS
ncbi:hypothetical protein ACVWY2_004390 [Bradyrhizobium sp. JR6.1]